MKLTELQFGQIRQILEDMDQGSPPPRVPDRLGRFLRQYGLGWNSITGYLAEAGANRRVDGAVSGGSLGPAQIHVISEPRVSARSFPLGDVADTLAVSEQLGGIVHVTTWLKGPIANTAFNLLRAGSSVQARGDYRWTPPAKWTPGEAELEASARHLRWDEARCLTAVADDIMRPPHALEFTVDFTLGAAGLKYFRAVCVKKRQGRLEILPALGAARTLTTEGASPPALAKLPDGALAKCFIYREPWEASWTIVAAAAVSAQTVFAHAVAWADFQRELVGSRIDGPTVLAIHDALRSSGLGLQTDIEPNISHQLLPAARSVLSGLRGIN